MSGFRAQVVLLLAVLLSCAGPVFGTQRHLPPKSPAKDETPAPQLPPAPPSPQTLAQMPASPPQVTYDNGALTIVAQNSTLGDILRAVHAKTGAVMDIDGSATERVVSRFGPGSPRDVLAQLLNGSSFNYVILGSAVDAGMVQRVVLSPKPASGAEEANAPAPANPGEPNPFPRVQPPATGQEMSDDDSDDANDSEAQDQPATTAPAAEGQSNQPAIKTPEQLLQELQRQQQQLQQQQSQPGGQPQPNPRQQ